MRRPLADRSPGEILVDVVRLLFLGLALGVAAAFGPAIGAAAYLWWFHG